MVELCGVTKRFGATVAVDAVDLAVRPGEFLTLLGPSGCGKTTMLRMISGFETPSAGRVMLEGVDVTHQPPYRREVNQVFQSYALFPHLSVRDNISFGLRMKKLPTAEIARRVAEATAMVALDGLENRRPDQLSGGQRQRVALARAVVNRPKVLLLDEPLSALDAKLRHATRAELKKLQTTLGITFVFVTHDQDEALAMSDRVAVVNKGKIEQLASPQEIYHRPTTRFVAEFVGQTNLIEATVTGRDAACARLALAGGPTIAVPSADVMPDAQRVTVSIRPEMIRVNECAVPGENAFEARVEEVQFRGATDELTLRTPGGLVLNALIADDDAHARPGDVVYCQVIREDVVVLRDRTA